MSHGTVLHLFGWDKKFVLPFRNFIHKHFTDDCHKFIIYGSVEESEVPSSTDTVVYKSLLKNIFVLSMQMHKAEKIILHGMFNSRLFYILLIQPWVLKKCYWVIWGGDLYVHEAPVKDWRWRKNDFFRHQVIKRLGHFVTQVSGDYELAKSWYGARGQYHECFMYPSNLYKKYEITPKDHKTINIQIGNSADPTNNHIDALEKLLIHKDKNIKIFVPLSYGSRDHATKVIEFGEREFGDMFQAMNDFMPLEKYIKFLAEIDIALFNHRRQQAMGNATTLLGIGKKVYMRSDVTSWTFLKKLGLTVFDIERFDLTLLSEAQANENRKIVSNYFSETNLVKQLEGLFQ